MKTPIDEPITMFKKQFNFLSMAAHPFPNFRLNKIAARWLAKAVAQFYFY